MLSILTHTHLVQLPTSSVPKAPLCLQRFWALQSMVLSIGLSMHVNRPFSRRSMVHMPCCLPVLLRVARPLHSNRGGEGTFTWGTFPRGCEGTVARRCFLYKEGGRGIPPTPCNPVTWDRHLAENYEAEVLLAPKQNFGRQPQTLEREEGGARGGYPPSSYGVRPL